MLSNIRDCFSESDIGRIATQVLQQLAYLHDNEVECKYFTPSNLIVTAGFQPNEEIQVQIVDIAILNILDIALPNLANRYGYERMFLAPELTKISSISLSYPSI